MDKPQIDIRLRATDYINTIPHTHKLEALMTFLRTEAKTYASLKTKDDQSTKFATKSS